MVIISHAYAQNAAASTPGLLESLLPVILIGVIFYLFLIRPQQKKFKAHQERINALAKKDEILTSGGIYGKVTKISDDTAHIEIAPGVEVKVKKSTISDIITPDTKKQVTTEKAKEEKTGKNRKK